MTPSGPWPRYENIDQSSLVHAQLHDSKVIGGPSRSEWHTGHNDDELGGVGQALGPCMCFGLFHHLLIGVDVLRVDAVGTPEQAQTPCHVPVRRDGEDRDIRPGPGDAARGGAA